MKAMKMQGCGNDFVVVGDWENWIDKEKAVVICDRHFGIGADGVIALSYSGSKDAQYEMKVFNADGSETEMCGNGIRCAAKWLVDNGFADIGEIPILTKAGIIVPRIMINTRINAEVKVNMGAPVFYNPNQFIGSVGNKGLAEVTGLLTNRTGYYIGMGNPHVVFFVEQGIGNKFVDLYGKSISDSVNIFPNKVNVHFVEDYAERKFRVYTYERGSGRTLACGTGACASYVAAVKTNRIEPGIDATMILPGGALCINWTGKESDSVFMTGSARNVTPVSLEFLIK